MKFCLKIAGVLFFFYLLGFYFGNFNIGYMNVKAKMRSMCQCQVLHDAEKQFYALRKLFKNQFRKIDTHDVDQ